MTFEEDFILKEKKVRLWKANFSFEHWKPLPWREFDGEDNQKEEDEERGSLYNSGTKNFIRDTTMVCYKPPWGASFGSPLGGRWS